MYYLGYETDILFEENFNRDIIFDVFKENIANADFFKVVVPRENEKLINILEEYSVYSEDIEIGISKSAMLDNDLKDILIENLFSEKILSFLEISLYRKDKLILEINSFGSEIYVYDLDKISSESLANKLEKNYNIKSQIFYDEDENIEETHNHEHCQGDCNCKHNHH